jgi:hypothetical protein
MDLTFYPIARCFPAFCADRCDTVELSATAPPMSGLVVRFQFLLGGRLGLYRCGGYSRRRVFSFGGEALRSAEAGDLGGGRGGMRREGYTDIIDVCM